MAIKFKFLVKKALMVAKHLIYPKDRPALDTPAASSKDYASPLRPYCHQVGGHAAIFQLDENHVCKPFNKSEADFYNEMPAQLRKWTPEFCFEVELKENEFTNTVDLAVSSPNPCSSNHSKGQQLAACSVESNRYDFLDVYSGLGNDANINPWALECQLRSMKSDRLPLNRFIVFENLARDFQAPNVLDLKLGTRQYSDNATDSKKQQQRLKCAKSTSKQLGLRMCGLQYFDENIEAFQCLDKYYGRNLNESGLYKLLAHFFKNRTNDCLLLMEQIEKIKQEIESRPGLRLFGVSLLIILEGRSDVAEPAAPIARLIDFAHASMTEETTLDTGCIMGLQNLLVNIKAILAS